MQNYNVERRSNIPVGEEAPAELGEMDIELIEDDIEEVLGEQPAGDPSSNIAANMDPDELKLLGDDLMEWVESDYNSMEDWRRIIKDGLAALGLANDEKDNSFEGASNVTHPLLLESVVKYQAKARAQILPPDGPVKCRVVGTSTEDKRERARRKAKYMNFLCQEEIFEYEPEHDRMLFYQGFLGSGITKTFYDHKLGRISSRNVSAYNFIVDYYAADFNTAQRLTEVFTMSTADLYAMQDAGRYLEVEIEPSYSTSKFGEIDESVDRLIGRVTPQDRTDVHKMLECHVKLCLDWENPVYDPNGDVTPQEHNYVVTMHAESGKILSIYLNEDDAGQRKQFYTHWPFIPGFGIFGFGYLHLIGGLSESSTKVLRQLLNAGVFSNFPAGFKSHGIRVVGSSEPLMPGEWRDVHTLGQDLNRALVPLPYKEPSGTLAKLLEFIVSAGQRFADSVEEVVNNSKNYGPVNTTLALMEASGQLFNGIHERLFRSQKNELRIMERLVLESGITEYPFDVAPAERSVIAEDFQKDLEILPSANPKMPSEAHRLARAMSHFQVASQSPDHHNMPEILKELHRALGEEAPERYVKTVTPPPPLDPVTENSMLLSGQGVKAYPGQLHEAHLFVHIHGLLNNPLYAQNKMVMAQAEAHVQEHMGMKFKADIERMIGQPIPEVDPKDPTAMEVQNNIAMMASQQVEQLVKMNTMEAMDMIRRQVQLDPALELEFKRIATQDRKVSLDELKMVTEAMNSMMMHRDQQRLDWAEFRHEREVDKRELELEKYKIDKTANRPTSGK